MVAIPTGILSAGFVDQFSRIKRMSEYANEKDINFIKIHLTEQDFWSGLPVKALRLPAGFLVAAIQRDERVIVPRGNVILRPDDILVLGAASYDEETHINLKEIVLRKQHPWNGERIKDLDMSRQTIILMVKRDGKTLIPNGNFILMENDTLITYTQVHRLHNYETINI
jgi:voltage-gated potassium channel